MKNEAFEQAAFPTFKIGTLFARARTAIEITLQPRQVDKNLAARLLGVATRTIYRHLERESGESGIRADTGEIEVQ